MSKRSMPIQMTIDVRDHLPAVPAFAIGGVAGVVTYDFVFMVADKMGGNTKSKQFEQFDLVASLICFSLASVTIYVVARRELGKLLGVPVGPK